MIITHTEVAGKEPNELLLATCKNVAPGSIIIHHTGGGRQKAMVAVQSSPRSTRRIR